MSISEWLDGIKAGFGGRFAVGLHDAGFEDLEDLKDQPPTEKELRKCLEPLGAKKPQLGRIMNALQDLVSPEPESARPAEPTAPMTAQSASAGEAATSASPHRPSADVVAAVRWPLQKTYACFLSHYKKEAATEARLCQMELEKLLGAPVFLDSDNLRDLRTLLNDVRESDVLVLLQTTNLLTRPWCLLEIVTAIDANVPIVAINVRGAHTCVCLDAARRPR